jgi:hypothetical protein
LHTGRRAIWPRAASDDTTDNSTTMKHKLIAVHNATIPLDDLLQGEGQRTISLTVRTRVLTQRRRAGCARPCGASVSRGNNKRGALRRGRRSQHDRQRICMQINTEEIGTHRCWIHLHVVNAVFVRPVNHYLARVSHDRAHAIASTHHHASTRQTTVVKPRHKTEQNRFLNQPIPVSSDLTKIDRLMSGLWVDTSLCILTHRSRWQGAHLRRRRCAL